RWVASTRVRVSGLATLSRSEISSAIWVAAWEFAVPCGAAATLNNVKRPNSDKTLFMSFSFIFRNGWLAKPAQSCCVPCLRDILDGRDPTGNAPRHNSRSTGHHLMKVFSLNILWLAIDLLLSLNQRCLMKSPD